MTANDEGIMIVATMKSKKGGGGGKGGRGEVRNL